MESSTTPIFLQPSRKSIFLHKHRVELHRDFVNEGNFINLGAVDYRGLVGLVG